MACKAVDMQIAESNCFGKGYDYRVKECKICEARKGCAVAYSQYIQKDFDELFVDSRNSLNYAGIELFKIEDAKTGKDLSNVTSAPKTELPTTKHNNKRNRIPNKISYPDDMPNYSILSIEELQEECKKKCINYLPTWMKMHYVTALRKCYTLEKYNEYNRIMQQKTED